ncbi:DNA polymerase III subunit delta [Malacoplasma muris]|uniref:DNA polymerase III subunit delta n=1 Tax=Malacoplasma muris TaxID=2119 RepID=UPI00398F0CAC
MILIYSNDVGQVCFELNKLLGNNKDINKFYYDDNLEYIEEKLFQYSIFDINTNIASCVIIDNLDFLSNAKLSVNESNFLESLKQLPSKVYVICYSNKISKNAFSFFEQSYYLKQLNKYTVKKFIIDYLNFNNFYFDNKLVDVLAERLPLNGSYIASELNKLFVFKLTEINIDLINSLISYDVDSNIFKLVDNFLNDRSLELIQQIKYFEEIKIDFFSILNILISQLYSLKLYIQYFNVNKNIDSLEKDFGVVRFQIENWINLFSKYNNDYIDILLKNLLELEKDIFSGRKDINQSLKLFLIKGVNYENNL